MKEEQDRSTMWRQTKVNILVFFGGGGLKDGKEAELKTGSFEHNAET